MLNEVVGILTPQDFYGDEYGEYYQAVLSLAERREPIDQITIAKAARKALVGENALQELSGIVAITPQQMNAEHYAKIVREMAQRRRMIANAGRIAALAYDEPDWEKAQTQARALLDTTFQTPEQERLLSMDELILDTLPQIEDLLEHAGTLPGRSTSLSTLDRKIRGLDKAKLYIIAGRPSMGKTQFSLYLARQIVSHGLPVVYFSADTSKKWFLLRVAMMELGGDPLLQPERFRESLSFIAKLPLYMNDKRGQEIAVMRTQLKRFLSEQGRVGGIVFDYLELAGGRGRSESEEQRLSSLARGFKDLAREFDCPMLLLSQLNREVEKRESGIPRLSDTRYAGEAEADVWMGLYRKEWYLAQRGQPVPSEDLHKLIVNVGKNKDGDTGHVALYYNAVTGEFRDWEG